MPSKKSRIQFYADECFPVTSATYLKSLGISVIHAYDRNLVEKKDQVHLQLAKKLNRVLLTVDRDFLYYNQVNLDKHPGVVVISVGTATTPNINKVCDKLLKNITKELVKDSLVKITSDKIIKLKNNEIKLEKKI